MNSAIINRGSQVNDVLGLLTGEWAETDRDGWHIVKTPFFVSVTGTVGAGSHALPFRVRNTCAGLLYKQDNSVEAVVVRPGDTAVDMPGAGLFRMDLFGNQADVASIL